jgi:hypothetical protein
MKKLIKNLSSKSRRKLIKSSIKRKTCNCNLNSWRILLWMTVWWNLITFSSARYPKLGQKPRSKKINRHWMCQSSCNNSRVSFRCYNRRYYSRLISYPDSKIRVCSNYSRIKVWTRSILSSKEANKTPPCSIKLPKINLLLKTIFTPCRRAIVVSNNQSPMSASKIKTNSSKTYKSKFKFPMDYCHRRVSTHPTAAPNRKCHCAHPNRYPLKRSSSPDLKMSQLVKCSTFRDRLRLLWIVRGIPFKQGSLTLSKNPANLLSAKTWWLLSNLKIILVKGDKKDNNNMLSPKIIWKFKQIKWKVQGPMCRRQQGRGGRLRQIWVYKAQLPKNLIKFWDNNKNFCNKWYPEDRSQALVGIKTSKLQKLRIRRMIFRRCEIFKCKFNKNLTKSRK